MTRLEKSPDTGLPVVYINGTLTDQISVYDRALQYGDGLFETIAIKNGWPALLDLHMQRLRNGLDKLGFPEIPVQSITDDIIDKSSNFKSAVLKLVITRGISQRGYNPPKKIKPAKILAFSDKIYPENNQLPEAISICFCSSHIGINPSLAGIKHLNRLEQVMAKKESNDLGFDDGLMQDVDGNIIEGTSANLFLWQGGKLTTPDLQRCGIAGVVRQLILQTAEKMDIPLEIRNISRIDCTNADALFLTNSLNGIIPVANLGETNFDAHNWPAELYKEVMNHVYS